MLFAPGIDICLETVRLLWSPFGPLFTADIRSQRVSRTPESRLWRWHLDEAIVRINGKRHYLLRAVDHEGEIQASFVTKKRDTAGVLMSPKKALN